RHPVPARHLDLAALRAVDQTAALAHGAVLGRGIAVRHGHDVPVGLAETSAELGMGWVKGELGRHESVGHAMRGELYQSASIIPGVAPPARRPGKRPRPTRAGAGPLTPLLSPAEAPRRRRFRRALLAWYARHRRDLPWRQTRDPYRVLVSEIMLQQTQVDRVIPKYHEFLSRYPT